MTQSDIARTEDWISLGTQAQADGKYQEAIRCFLTAKAQVENDCDGSRLPDVLKIYKELGRLFYSSGLINKAIFVLTRARLLYTACDSWCTDADPVEIFQLLGMCYQKIGDYYHADVCLNNAYKRLTIIGLKEGAALRSSIIASRIHFTVGFIQTAREWGATFDLEHASDRLSKYCSEGESALRELPVADFLPRAQLRLALSARHLLQKQNEDAYWQIQDSIQDLERFGSPTHPMFLDLLVHKANCEAALARYKQLEVTLRRAIEIGQQAFGPDSIRLIETFVLLLKCPNLLFDDELIAECARLIDIEVNLNHQFVYSRFSGDSELLLRMAQTDQKARKSRAVLDLLSPWIDSQSAVTLVPAPNFTNEENWLASQRRTNIFIHDTYASNIHQLSAALKLQQRFEEQEEYLRQAIKIQRRLLSLYPRFASFSLALTSEEEEIRAFDPELAKWLSVRAKLDRLHLELGESLLNQNRAHESREAFANVSEFFLHYKLKAVSLPDIELYDAYATYLRQSGQSKQAESIESHILHSLEYSALRVLAPIKFQFQLFLAGVKLRLQSIKNRGSVDALSQKRQSII